MVISVGFEKNVKNVKKGFKKSKHGQFIVTKCQFRILNCHSVGVHAQKNMHLRETRPPRPAP